VTTARTYSLYGRWEVVTLAEWTVADDVLLHEEEGEALLLNVSDGNYYALNRTGAVVWQALNDGVDPVEAVAAAWPDIARETVAGDVRQVLDEFEDAGLARPRQDPAS
jgi:hypothetical protein